MEWISPFYFILALALMHVEGRDLDPWHVGGLNCMVQYIVVKYIKVKDISISANI